MSLSIMSVLATNVTMVTLFTGSLSISELVTKVAHSAGVLEYIRDFRPEPYSVRSVNFV